MKTSKNVKRLQSSQSSTRRFRNEWLQRDEFKDWVINTAS